MESTTVTREQIIGVLKEGEAGRSAGAPARASEATIYDRKSRYSGLEVSEARRMKELDSENAKLKRLLADAMLDKVELKDVLAKRVLATAAKREAVVHL